MSRTPNRFLCALVATAAVLLVALAALTGTGCGGPGVVSIGRPGTGDGEFRDPRGVAVSDSGIAVLDRTGRLQVFGLDGVFRRSIVVVPGDVRRGLPTGVTWLPDGDLAIAHTHQSRIVVLSPEGVQRRTFGEYGVAPGQFLYPQRIVQDADGNFVVSEYGFDKTNRVQVLRSDGAPLRVLGGGTAGEGGLGRAMGALPLADGRVLVADEFAGMVLFAKDGHSLGRFGPELPEGALPRGVCRGADGDVYVAIGGALHEVRRFSPEGALRGAFGEFGDAPERFREPWDVAWHAGRLYLADMGNHRIARIDPEAVAWRRP
ncbi:MAG: hypothetical protein K8T90_20840 [Planctomycetes bacterium]|nr:hypothetical protein [Planctomycetota bacterium]